MEKDSRSLDRDDVEIEGDGTRYAGAMIKEGSCGALTGNGAPALTGLKNCDGQNVLQACVGDALHLPQVAHVLESRRSRRFGRLEANRHAVHGS